MRESNPRRGLDFLQSGPENLRATITPMPQNLHTRPESNRDRGVGCPCTAPKTVVLAVTLRVYLTNL